MTTFIQDFDTFFLFVEKHPPSCYTRERIEKSTYKGDVIYEKLVQIFCSHGFLAIMLGTAGVASADEYEYEGYDENGNYVYAIADDEGNVAAVAVDADGNYSVSAEGADGSTYDETGSY